MTRRSLWIVAALALMILVPIQPAHAQCTPLTLTVNGSSSVTLSPGSTLMIAEGSVLISGNTPRGAVRDVAPEGFPHPVFRAGFAVTVPIPWRAPV